jgi:hypothetical protein
MKTQHITRVTIEGPASGSSVVLLIRPPSAPKVGSREWREHARKRGSSGRWIADRMRQR